MKTHSHLNQSLVKRPAVTMKVLPQILPDFMGFKELEFIEVFDSLEIPLIEFCGLGQLWTPIRSEAVQ